MATVYFDACFYSYLGAAGEEEADRSLARLRRLGARPVLSRALVGEILASDGRNQQKLSERVSKLPTPLALDEGLGWDVLQETPDPEFHRALGAASDRVTAASAAARTGSMTREQAERLSTEHGLPAPQWDVQGEGVAAAGLAQIQALMTNPATLQAFAAMGIEVPPLPTSIDHMMDWSRSLMAAMREVVPDAMAQVEVHQQMFDSTGGGGPSLGAVAVDDAGKKARARVRDRANDSQHMALFARNSEWIDFLHIDGVRWRQLSNNQDHALRQRGLQERCFAGGNTVTGIVDALVERVEMLGWPTTSVDIR